VKLQEFSARDNDAETASPSSWVFVAGALGMLVLVGLLAFMPRKLRRH
jgi:high-affinity Fe2+/Pb2+ permease